MTQKFMRWDPVDHLKTDEDMALYLDACLDEDPGDGAVFVLRSTTSPGRRA